MYTIEKDIENIQAELESDKANLEEANLAQEQLEVEAKEKKKEQSVFTKESLLCDKRIAKKKGELDKKASC